MRKDDKDESRYDDIINRQAHVSDKRSQMLLADRAAQFSPFAALTGYEDAIKETSRLTDQKIELDEMAKTKLDEKLRILQEELRSKPEVEIVYFVADESKDGGKYATFRGIVKKIDAYDQIVLMEGGERIRIQDIVDLQGEILKALEDGYA